MAVSGFSKIRGNVRASFRDEGGTFVSDDDLDALIDLAQADWCVLTGTLVGRKDVVTNESGVLPLPDDCIRPTGLTLSNGLSLPVFPWRTLVRFHGDFRRQTGDCPVAVCFDFDQCSGYRLFPKVPSGLRIGTLEYSRRPKEGVLEIREDKAIEAYCLAMLCSLTGKDGSQWERVFINAASAYGGGRVGRTGGRYGVGRFF